MMNISKTASRLSFFRTFCSACGLKSLIPCHFAKQDPLCLTTINIRSWKLPYCNLTAAVKKVHKGLRATFWKQVKFFLIF